MSGGREPERLASEAEGLPPGIQGGWGLLRPLWHLGLTGPVHNQVQASVSCSSLEYTLFQSF